MFIICDTIDTLAFCQGYQPTRQMASLNEKKALFVSVDGITRLRSMGLISALRHPLFKLKVES